MTDSKVKQGILKSCSLGLLCNSCSVALLAGRKKQGCIVPKEKRAQRPWHRNMSGDPRDSTDWYNPRLMR